MGIRMKRLFEKLQVSKMDEMEVAISLKAKRNALFFIEASLLIWMIYDMFQSAMHYDYQVNWLPAVIILITISIENISTFIMQRHATAGDEEYEATKEKKNIVSASAWMMVIIIVLFIVAIVGAGALRMVFFKAGVLS